MIKNWFWAILFSPLALLAQEKGVAFEHNLTWNQILKKAKSEHKYVFVDCYASWCGPCKIMDRDVYLNDTVGEFINQRFIAVKVQMDQTSRDNSVVKEWYPIAQKLEQEYKINAYPSFLFFSPDGQAIDKQVGDRDVRGFVEMARKVMDPEEQFYTLFTHYSQGRKVYRELPKLSRMAKGIGDDSLATVLARDYMDNYLLALRPVDCWTMDNIQFMNDYGNVITHSDQLFKSYFRDRKVVNIVMHDTVYADGLINRVIYKDMVKPAVQSGIATNLEPDWVKLEKNIKKHYGYLYVDRNVIPGKVSYYEGTKQWELYAKYFVLRMKQVKIENWPAGGQASTVINNNAFEVFKYSKNKEELEAALSWINKAIAMGDHPDANELDTKANILYKLGRTEEGLKLEAQCRSLDPNDKEIQEAYDKMKKGLPTWPTQ